MTATSPSPPHTKFLEEIDKRRKEAQQSGRLFTAYTKQNLQDPDSAGRRPIIAWQSWLPAVPAGEDLPYTAGIFNLSPHRYNALFAYLYVGPPNMGGANAGGASDPMVSALTQRNALNTMTYATVPPFPGLDLDPGSSGSLSVSLPTQVSAVAGQYPATCVLFQAGWHTPASYCDSSLFIFGVR